MKCRHINPRGECSALGVACEPGGDFCQAVILQYGQDKKYEEMRKNNKRLKKINEMTDADLAAARQEKERREQAQTSQDTPEA